MTSQPVLHLVVSAAGPAQHVDDLVRLLMADGWTVCLILTPTAATWLDRDALAARTGHPVRVEPRRPGDPEPHPEPDAVAVAPATFNVVNKWATGVNDSVALGQLNEAIGTGVPAHAFPRVGDLGKHPAYAGHLRLLRDAGVLVTDLPDVARAGWQPVVDALHPTLKRITTPPK
ncbi:flavoprotein [Micromonospora sp. WMMD882]|uniref:flavoprotein n=1 Tax=Micromonospora sp. WMMD882 TaxID=3015151 RepID=UPI00248B7DFC|nr:flavoprotein [Micromonospora sp. WMMD882]WBB77256.1 flavoprotein [Micromonospora sp. WMMD882]